MLDKAPVPQMWFGFVQEGCQTDTPLPSQSSSQHRQMDRLDGRDPVLERQAKEMLNHLGLFDGSTKVHVLWNPKLRSTAGYAKWPLWRIELNPKLNNFPGEVDRTLKHELAHLIAYARAGKRRIEAHGVEWRQACVDLGIPNESARHSLPLPRTQQTKRWIYQCPQCLTKIERVRRFNRYCACLACCKKFNQGQYDPRFQLELVDHLES